MRRIDARKEDDSGSRRPPVERSEGTDAGSNDRSGRVRAVQRAAGNQAVAAHVRDGSDATSERSAGGSATARGRGGVGPSVSRPVLRSVARSSDEEAGVEGSLDGDPTRDLGSGRSLPASERSFFESRMGRDFGDVSVHAGDDAARVARSLDARAFASGTDVVFGEGEYRPGTTGGRRLMAHELTHVAQSEDGVRARGEVSDPGDPAERHAERVADAVMAGGDAAPLVGRGPGGPSAGRAIHRKAGTGTTTSSGGGSAGTSGGGSGGGGSGSAKSGGKSGAKSGGSGGGSGEYADEIRKAKKAIENGNEEKARSIILSVIGEVAKAELERATKDLKGDMEADGDALEGPKPTPLIYWIAEKKMKVEEILKDPEPRHYALGAGLGVGAAAVVAATRSELPPWIVDEGVDLLQGEVKGDWGKLSGEVTDATIEGPAFDPTAWSASGKASYEKGGFSSTVEGGYDSGKGGSVSGQASYETEAFESMVKGSWDPASGASGSGLLQYDSDGFSSKLTADYKGPNDVTSNLALNYAKDGLKVNLTGEHRYDGSDHSIEFLDGSVSGPLASGLSGNLRLETGTFDVSGPGASLPQSVRADVGLDAGGEGWDATLDGTFESGPSGTRVNSLTGTAGIDITPNLRGDFEAWYERTPDPIVGVGGNLKLVNLPNTEGKLDFEYGQAPGGGNRTFDVGLSVDHQITEGVNVGAGGSYSGEGNVSGQIQLTIDPSKLGN